MSDDGQAPSNSPEIESLSASAPPDMKNPRVALSLLEADQVVAAKQRMRFGRRRLSPGVRFMLWGLRIYVCIMLVLVLVSVIRAIHLAH
jgi:hypothetical protein